VPSRQWFLLRHGFSIRNLENNCKRKDFRLDSGSLMLYACNCYD
jgi:hypothetical protein